MIKSKSNHPFITIAFSKYLLYILAATIIWGFFPLFLYFMGDFPSDFPAAYLLFRYIAASIIFLTVLFILLGDQLPVVGRFVRAYGKTILYSGIVLFSARYFETLAFEHNIVTFAVIFSVAFVPLMEPIAVYGLYRPKLTAWFFRRCFGEDVAAKMAAITGEKENYWLEYVITLAIVFSTAMFFIYGMEGNFNIFHSEVPPYAYGFVLLAALTLQLYFHALDFGFPDKGIHLSVSPERFGNKLSETLSGFTAAIIKQSMFAVIIVCSCLIWNVFSTKSPFDALHAIENPVSFWLSLIGGLVVLGSIVAYVFDNFGFDRYEAEKSSLPFRIRGVEWLGISTLMDPMVSNILTAFFPVLAGSSEGTQSHPIFFGISLTMILMLMVLKVLIMRYSKLHEFKVFCFSYLRSFRTSGQSVHPDYFSSVALLRNGEAIRNEANTFEIQELHTFHESDIPTTNLTNHLQYQLWLFNSNNLEIRNKISVWVMKRGKLLYDAGHLFERLLFHEHMRYFCSENHIRDGRILIFFPDKLGYDETRLKRLLEANTEVRIEEDDQLFYFLDIQEMKDMPERIQRFMRKRWDVVKNRHEIERIRNEVMMGVLERGE